MPVQHFQLTNFMANLKDGARPNRFYVDIALPAAMSGAIVEGVAAENKMRFACRASSLPASTVGEVIVPFKGAQFKIAGDRTFADWSVTVMNDTDFLIRNALEQWSDYIVGHVEHDTLSDIDPLAYLGNGEVAQLSRNNDVLKTYHMVGIWPSEIGDIALDWGSNDQLEEFTVTFKVQWFETDTTRNNTNIDKFEG